MYSVLCGTQLLFVGQESAWHQLNVKYLMQREIYIFQKQFHVVFDRFIYFYTFSVNKISKDQETHFSCFAQLVFIDLTQTRV